MFFGFSSLTWLAGAELVGTQRELSLLEEAFSEVTLTVELT